MCSCVTTGLRYFGARLIRWSPGAKIVLKKYVKLPEAKGQKRKLTENSTGHTFVEYYRKCIVI